eukprot:TRINITY_DN13041_c0_g1_i1.p1 TRINITY_DN13041_c0_g1~~TRINITY_DN13041_c0_g1_i1.p1  ORF type:complete len:336 (+),score=50.93 TRINITY_DN13041_c0_g1_i1:22-1008(+)
MTQLPRPPHPLPKEYDLLSDLFAALHTVLTYASIAKSPRFWANIKEGVQVIVKRDFTEKHVRQMLTVLPGCITLRWQGEQLHFDLNRNIAAAPQVFRDNLRSIVASHHSAFVKTSFPGVNIEKLLGWHPKFALTSLPPIALADLPPDPKLADPVAVKAALEASRPKRKLAETVSVQQAIEQLSASDQRLLRLVDPAIIAKAEERSRAVRQHQEQSALAVQAGRRDRLRSLPQYMWIATGMNTGVCRSEMAILIKKMLEHWDKRGTIQRQEAEDLVQCVATQCPFYAQIIQTDFGRTLKLVTSKRTEAAKAMDEFVKREEQTEDSVEKE